MGGKVWEADESREDMKPSAVTHTLSSYGKDQGRPEETGGDWTLLPAFSSISESY